MELDARSKNGSIISKVPHRKTMKDTVRMNTQKFKFAIYGDREI